MAMKWLHRLRLNLLARRPHYMLDPDLLVPGDVILSTQKAAASFLIRLGTRSQFSHAAIYLGGGLYAEAVGLGVRVRAVATMIKTGVKVFRLKPGGSPDAAAIAVKASACVNDYIHAPYWKAGAMLSIYKATVLEKRHRLFCSHLVAQAYKDAGLEVVPSLDPTKVTPALLSKSAAFDDVSASVVKRLWMIPDFVADPHFESLSDRETTLVQDMRADAADWFAAQGIPVPDTWADMVFFLSADSNPARRNALDRALMSVLARHGYVRLLEDIRKQVLEPMQQWLDDFDALVISNKQLAVEYYFLEQALPALETQTAIAKDNAEHYTEVNARAPAETFEFLAIHAAAHGEMSRRCGDLTKLMMNAIWARFPADWRETAWAEHRRQTAGGGHGQA